MGKKPTKSTKPLPWQSEGYSFRKWFERQLVQLQARALEIIQTGEQHIPMYVIYSSDGHTAAVPLFTLEPEHKDPAFHLLKLLAGAPNVHAAMMITESWTVARDPRDPNYANIDMSRSLADAPDRKEAMIWNCLSHGQQLLAMRAINRETKDWEGETMIMDPGKELMTGRMVQNDDPNQTQH